jgi:hypothetical protein
VLLQARARWRTAEAAASVEGAFTAAASVEAVAFVAGALTVAGFAVALTAVAVAFVMVAFAAVGSTIAISTIDLSSLAIFGTRSFTILIHTTDTIPTAITLMVTDTVAFAAAAFAAAAFVAVAFVAVGEPPDEEKSIHQSVFQRLGNKSGSASVVLNECNRA